MPWLNIWTDVLKMCNCHFGQSHSHARLNGFPGTSFSRTAEESPPRARVNPRDFERVIVAASGHTKRAGTAQRWWQTDPFWRGPSQSD